MPTFPIFGDILNLWIDQRITTDDAIVLQYMRMGIKMSFYPSHHVQTSYQWVLQYILLCQVIKTLECIANKSQVFLCIHCVRLIYYIIHHPMLAYALIIPHTNHHVYLASCWYLQLLEQLRALQLGNGWYR